MTQDTRGREYAKTESVRIGTTLEADGSFSCLHGGEQREVKMDVHRRFYVDCEDGEHLLDGQLSDCGIYYVGFYSVSPK